MTTNREFIEEIMAESEEDPGLLIDEDCSEPSQSYFMDGVLYVIGDESKYGVPLEDIKSIQVRRNEIVFLLITGSSKCRG